MLAGGCRAVATGPTAAQPLREVADPPVTLPAVHPPKGSFALDFGQLRLWLPSGWTASGAGSCAPPYQTVFLGNGCPRPGSSGDYLWVRAGAAPAAAAIKLTVNPDLLT
ncbi:MAG: hypothetical protein ACYCUG_02710 [Acidimicrobiales bacterium]